MSRGSASAPPEEQGDRAERDAEQAVELRAQEEHRRRAERERREDRGLQDAAEEGEVRLVDRQRVARDEEIGQEEAELAEHAQHAEQARGDRRALAEADPERAAQRHGLSMPFSAGFSQPLAVQKWLSNGCR